MIPPYWAWLRVNGFGIFLPLFLLWPFLILCLPFAFLAGLITGHPLRATGIVWQIFCSFRGLQLEVRQPDQTVMIQVR